MSEKPIEDASYPDMVHKFETYARKLSASQRFRRKFGLRPGSGLALDRVMLRAPRIAGRVKARLVRVAFFGS
ncbi:MAG: hypothetical protein OEU92_17135, partial [Alphaproteobacteria bacterium]|nr:hypothetical protein [Alphaproteobacteria bacterium]